MRVGAIEGDEVRFCACAFTGGQAAAAVEDASLAVQDDGLQEPVLADVVGECGEVVLVERGRNEVVGWASIAAS